MAEFTFTTTKEIGIIGDVAKAHKTIVLGHYNNYTDKVYVFDHFFKRDGSMDSKVVAKFTTEEFNALKEMTL